MSNPPLAVPFFQPDIGDEEIAEVVHSLKNGWVTTGQKARQFEEAFATFLQAGAQPDEETAKPLECVAVNSATAGLHLALEALGIGPGDEVIVPDFTFTATAEVVRYLGADPVFADIDAQTLNITTASIEAKISKRTKAVIIVHFAGLSVDMTAILQLVRRHDLRLIEDAAHALPATHAGQMIGTLASDATVFSFYATKTITTGEGGMIATRNSEIASRCKVMRLHGIDRDAFARYTTNKVSWQYDVVAPGYKYNMTDIAASIGIHQLKKADRFQQRRQQIARHYSDQLADLPLILPVSAPNGDKHSWHLYVIRLAKEASIDRDGLINALNDKGIKCSVHFIPLHRLSYWRERYNLQKTDFPNAENIFNTCLSLPLFPKMTDEQIEHVTASLKTVLS